MNTTSCRQTLTRRALIATASIAAAISLAACSPSSHSAAPTASPAGKPTATGQPSGCQANPSSAPMPRAEELRPVPPIGRISVALSGITSGTVKPGDPPTEVDVTLCNDSPVDYPTVGVVLVLERCSCATSPNGMPSGTVERFDLARGAWIKLEHPVMTRGMDYLDTFTNVQELPKGKTVTLRYRVALNPSMTDGKGGLEATVVTPGRVVQIGKANLPFTVSNEPTTPSAAPSAGARQTLLPVTGLTYPEGMAVDANGDVYVTDTWNKRVLKLAAGSSKQTVLPFTGLHKPVGVAVDRAGDVFVTDATNNRVLKLPAGSDRQTVLPFTGLSTPHGVAVDNAGNVYVIDGKERVIKLAAGSDEQTVLPFTGLSWEGSLAVDGAGNVFVSDPQNKRMLKMPAGSGEQTVLPVGGLEGSFVVDSAGDLYLADRENKQVLKVPAGSADATVLPFTGLNRPNAVAVDGAGNVYVLDQSGFGQIVKLAAG